MKPIVFIGGGGHAMSVLNAMSDIERVVGYADLRVNETMHIQYLGTDEQVMAKYSPDEYDIYVAVVYTDEINMQLRKRIIDKYKAYHKSCIISSSAIVAGITSIDEGVCVLERAVVKAKELGANSIINTGAIIEHGCVIGENVLIATGAVLCGDVQIGNNCIIGAGCIIRDGVSICDNAIIGMGSVVINNITKEGVYIGAPAKLKQ